MKCFCLCLVIIVLITEALSQGNAGNCKDVNSKRCQRIKGFCGNRGIKMFCRKTCNQCGVTHACVDKSKRCSRFSNYCTNSLVKTFCSKTCGQCSSPSTVSPCPVCKDRNTECKAEECSLGEIYHNLCRKTCGKCPPCDSGMLDSAEELLSPPPIPLPMP